MHRTLKDSNLKVRALHGKRIADVKKDFEKIIEVSEQITTPKKRMLISRVALSILKAFSPLI